MTPVLATVLAGVLLLAVPARAQQPAEAHAEIKDPAGKSLGHVRLTQHPQGLLIRAELSDLPPGWHGFHVHEVGKCEPPAFQSAGGHFNPGGHKHGLAQGGPHAGDLPNLHAGPDGNAFLEYFTDALRIGDAPAGSVRTSVFTSGTGTASAVTVVAGGGTPSANILDQDGASLVVHAKADDYRTDPAGDSGDRIGCGVVEKRG